MGKLILLRHGQSVWNKENKFTGWVDVGLSEQGVQEAHEAGRKLKKQPWQISRVFTSKLTRAIDTASIVCKELGQGSLVFTENEALNERHYGDLQGLNKDEMRAKYGAEQVHIWRRSFAIKPPGAESLQDTCARAIPFYEKNIAELVKKGECVLVAAHGNSLRGLIKRLENLSDEEITGVEVPTGVPIVYTIDEHGSVISKEILA